MIDWAGLVTGALESDCSHGDCGNSPGDVGTDFDLQPIENKENVKSCSHIPTFPTTFEQGQDRTLSNAPSVPGGGGVAKDFAPDVKDAVLGCATCFHLHPLVLSGGYCAGDRPDLPHAYGPLHTLRVLPPDGGCGCASWLSVEILNF